MPTALHAKLRVVIDTSSMVSYVLTAGDVMCRVVELWRRDAIVLLTSPQTLAELRAVLARPSIQRLSVASLDEFVSGLARFSEQVPGALDLNGASRDPKDDKFLACAVEGHAHYLVSSDRDLLDLRAYSGVAIVNPGQFLLAAELYPMDAATMAERFGPQVLAEIHAALPLESATAQRAADALALLR